MKTKMLGTFVILAAVTALIATAEAKSKPKLPAKGAKQAAAQTVVFDLNGAGATFPDALYKEWIKQRSLNAHYDAVGSGDGIKQITFRHVDFGASDAPMTDAQLKAAPDEVLHVPTALGAVAVVYNLPGVNGQLKLTGEELAGIYLGHITYWDELAADNPQLRGVHKRIIVVYRSDGSGTTFQFTSFLDSQSKSFREEVGAPATAVYWSMGWGAAGNNGVGTEVQANPFSIGYADLNFALAKQLSYAAIKNHSGKFINPTLESVTAAAASFAGSAPSDLRFSLLNAGGDQSYPIATATWILVYKNQTDAKKAGMLANFLWWAVHEGQSVNRGLNYAPVPTQLQAPTEKLLRSINVNGKQVLDK